MPSSIKIGIIFFSLAIGLIACVESFDLPVQEGDVRFLVVDGYLDTSDGEIDLNLLRAAAITETEFSPETNAVVALEDSDGNLFTLHEYSDGKYKTTTPLLDVGREYRIYIKTTAGKEYRSLFVPIKETPEITEVSWTAEPDGVQVTLDSEDKDMNTRYYRFTYVETWEYHSRYPSYWKVQGDSIVMRELNELIDKCYRTQQSTVILTTTTSGLTEDKVTDFDLVFLPKGTEKLSRRYSILVKQTAISQETYDYYQKLKTTSQNLGTLFDPQPSKVTGNISNISDPAEIVLGYFDVGRSTEKRIFIHPQQLPAELQVVDDPLLCYVDTVKTIAISSFSTTANHLLIYQIYDEALGTIDYTYGPKECIDCRLKGGVTTKPAFW